MLISIALPVPELPRPGNSPLVDRPTEITLGDTTTVDLNYLVIGEADEGVFPTVTVVEEPHPKRSAATERELERLFNLCKEDHKAGDLKLLRHHLGEILEVEPSNAVAHFNLGVLNRDQGAHPEAEAYFRRAIKNDAKNPLYHQALGELMLIMRHLLFAAEAYENGLKVDPNNAHMLTALTDVRQKQRMPREVADLSRRNLALNPQSTTALFTLAWALLWLAEPEEALDAVNRALQLDPAIIGALCIRQVALSRLGQAKEAAVALADIESRAIKSWDSCIAAAETFSQLDEGAMAEHLLRVIVERQPNFVPAIQQLGRYLIVRSDLDEGFKLMSRVVELDPEQGDAQTSVALTLVRNGDFAQGWAKHHWRWKRSGCEPRWNLPIPAWDGQPLGDGGLLIWREQGIGDMVMYAGPAIGCRPLAGKIIIETNPRLRALLQRSFPDMIVVCREDLPETFLADHNVVAQCPNGDLPHILKLDMNDYPGKTGFLIAGPSDAKRLREKYQLLFPGKRLIGISWRSGNSSSAILRSIELPLWKPIFDVENCAFISLQYGEVSKDVEQLREEHGIEVYIDTEVNPMQDMDKFAAQIAALDLVASVDNSTIHVAGAIGKTTWALIPSAADWRWLTPDRTDTLWYSSLELFRQEHSSDWSVPIEAVAARLRDFSGQTIKAERQFLNLRCARQSLEFGGANVAELYFRQLLVDDPGFHPALAGLGRVALMTGHMEDAIGLFRRAVDAASTEAAYHRDLAKALHAGGRQQSAQQSIRTALQIAGQDIEALALAIEIERQLDNPDEAANFCARLLRIDPENREARLHLAQMQSGSGDFDIAEANFQRVLEAHPDDAAAVVSLGCLVLRREDLAEGWRGYARRFDAGLQMPVGGPNLPALSLHEVTSGDVSNQRLAVRPEPGLKDQIMFMRWLTALRRDTNFVAAELDPRLIPLLDQAATRISLFPTGSLQEEDASDLELSAQLYLGDLGSRYGSEIGRLGDAVPYLKADPERVAVLRSSYLGALGVKKLVGLCWRGADMAIPLTEWLPILQLEGIGFVSLQAGPVQQELHEAFDRLGKSAVRDPSIDPQTNLRGFASQIAAVDLVISIDEVPAHLAGALGVPTLCLLPRVADWRWFNADRVNSPWYPTMRLYRQVVDQDWAKPLNEIAAELSAWADSGRQGGQDE